MEASKSLKIFQSPRALSYLTEALSDKQAPNRVEIITLLGTFQDEQCIPPLTTQLLHPEIEVREAARIALKNLSALHELTLLIELLEYWDDHVMTSHVQYLTFLYLNDDQHLATILAGIFYGKNPHWGEFLKEIDKLIQQDEWRHIPFFSRVDISQTGLSWFQTVRLELQLKDHVRQLKKERSVLLCRDHLTRFVQVQGKYLSYYACRQCKTLNAMMRARQVVVVLDHTMKAETAHYGDTFRVNWFKYKKIVDFDIVEIGSCSEEEITSFCIEVGNDSDPYRAKNHKKHCMHYPARL